MTYRSQAGVVLLEVLVAFSILAVSLTVLLQVTGANTNRQKSVENRLLAMSHASTLLAEFGIGSLLDAPAQSGDIDERYSWQLLASDIASHERRRDTKEKALSLVSLALTIQWQEGSTTKKYVVNTKRMAWQ